MKVQRERIRRPRIDLAAQPLDLLRPGEIKQRPVQLATYSGAIADRIDGNLVYIQEGLVQPGREILELLAVVGAIACKGEHVGDHAVTGHRYSVSVPQSQQAIEFGRVERRDRGTAGGINLQYVAAVLG